MHDHPATRHPDLLVGIGGSDDAGVYRIDDRQAIVQTVDFFTPIVDDPFDWGRIAAANALSDVYAMGGDPLTALQLIGWPRDKIPFGVLERVVQGGLSVMEDAGCIVVGGHSIDDAEPKYGFAVTGTIPPDAVTANAGGTPGQILVLTKPIGTGIIATAIKNGDVSENVAAEAIETMAELNRGAAAAVRRIGVRTVTDVTGFGLLGHLSEIVRASEGASAFIDVASVPLLPGVLDLAASGSIPGGTRRNLTSVEPMLDLGPAGRESAFVLADAQTSGGLLLAVDAPLEAALLQALDDEGVRGWPIGRLVPKEFDHGPSGRIATS